MIITSDMRAMRPLTLPILSIKNYQESLEEDYYDRKGCLRLRLFIALKSVQIVNVNNLLNLLEYYKRSIKGLN